MRGLLAAILGLLSVPAMAQDWDCSDRANLPQQGINLCLAEAYRAADAELNAVYRAALARGSEARSNLLRDAQRLWIPYRDAACEAEAEMMRGGSGEPMMRLGCLVRITETRTKELRMFAGLN